MKHKLWLLLIGIILLLNTFQGYAQIRVFSREEALSEDNISKPRIYIENYGTQPLNDIILHYYFKADDMTDIVLEDYYTPCSSVSLENSEESNYYLVYNFNGTSIQPGQIIPDLGGNVVGLHTGTWTTFEKSDDYSNNMSGVFLENNKITVYNSNGELIYGTEPDPNPVQPPIPISLTAEYKDESYHSSTKTTSRIRISNTGETTVKDFILYYYFTAKQGKTPVVDDYYTPNGTITLQHRGGNDYRIIYDFTGITLLPGEVIPDNNGNSVGIHYNDWSFFDKTDDYSYDLNQGSWAVNNNIVITNSQGAVLYGIPPGPSFVDFDDSPSTPEETPEVNVTDNEIEGVDINCQLPGAKVVVTESEGELYQYLNINTFGMLNKVGKPALPSRIYYVQIPENADVNVTLNSSHSKVLPGYTIHPAQEDPSEEAIIPEDLPDPPFTIDKELYSSDILYPKNIVTIDSILEIRGTKLAAIRITPVQFNPGKKELIVHSEVDVSVKFPGGTQFYSPDSPSLAGILYNLLVNRPNILPYLREMALKNHYNNRGTYLIFTHDLYIDAVNMFAEWKQQMGYDVHVQSSSTWTPDQIHSEIAAILPDYFLLVGDQADVPVSHIGTGGKSRVTDIYYACLGGDTDKYADIAYGRVSVSSEQEAITALQKIINYEKEPVTGAGFYSHVMGASLFGDPDRDGYENKAYTATVEKISQYLETEHNKIADRIYYANPDVEPKYWNNGSYGDGGEIPVELQRPNYAWEGNNQMIIDSFNNHRFLMYHRDHGAYNGWSSPTFTNSNIELTTNNPYLPVVFSLNCGSGMFDFPVCFSEKMIRHPDGGGVGIIAPTTQTGPKYNDALLCGLITTIWPNPGVLPPFTHDIEEDISLARPVYKMGDVLIQARLLKEIIYKPDSLDETDKNKFFSYYYMGDPTMEIWTEEPEDLTAIFPQEITGEEDFVINDISSGYGVATLTAGDQLIAKTSFIGDSATIPIPAQPEAGILTLTITAHGYRPLINEINYFTSIPVL